AHANEIVANRIDVFIYDAGGSYALTHYEFLPNNPNGPTTEAPEAGEFGLNNPDATQFLTADFDVREGEKLVYVGLNLPLFIRERLKTGYYVNEVFEHDDLIDQLLSGTPSSGGSSNLAFFNTEVVQQPITTDGFLLEVDVSRLVAKVVVKA